MSYVYGYVGGSGVISGGCIDLEGTKMTEKLKDGLMGVRPLSCVRDEHGEVREQTVKQLFAKINEELDKLKFEITTCLTSLDTNITKEPNDEWAYDTFVRNSARGAIVAEEAADTITAITTLLEALGIGAEMRDEAQRCVNRRNMEQGRL